MQDIGQHEQHCEKSQGPSQHPSLLRLREPQSKDDGAKEGHVEPHTAWHRIVKAGDLIKQRERKPDCRLAQHKEAVPEYPENGRDEQYADQAAVTGARIATKL
jgi:hypothetical protein